MARRFHSQRFVFVAALGAEVVGVAKIDCSEVVGTCGCRSISV